MECRSKLAVQRGEERRENQPTAKKNRALRGSKKFEDWRKAVFERDNYTCQKCEARSKKGNPVYLEPHHIKQFAFYPELRFDINNGQTLCYKCHKKTKHTRVKK
jgi:5-methylcytosine-specific restriction endonuclease McrA